MPRPRSPYLFRLSFPILLFSSLLLQLGACRMSSDPPAKPELVYENPTVPDNIPEEFTPAVDSKQHDWLAPGKSTLNLKEHYRSMHRKGWEEALQDWNHSQTFTIQSRADAAAHHADLSSGTDAFWEGYQKARSQVEQRSSSN